MEQTTKRLRFAEPHTRDEGQEGRSDQSQTAPPCGAEAEPGLVPLAKCAYTDPPPLWERRLVWTLQEKQHTTSESTL
jgi:hypothetical protein